MEKVLFFPANKLGATICDIYNDHKAIVSQNTDRLKDGKFELAEISLFKHNIQGTSFLNPTAATTDNENSSYAETLMAIGCTGRISYGLYFRSDKWSSPLTGLVETIPDYYSSTWTTNGVTAFSNAVLGESKSNRYPDHGQEMYDISNGELGYDFVSQAYGTSGAAETINHIQWQKRYFKELADINITAGSFANGRHEASRLLPPEMIGMRSSGYSNQGDANISYSDIGRAALLNNDSTTRTWDAVRANQFSTQADSLIYTRTQIQRAISSNGWFSDFMHWHSLYDFDDTPFFDTFYGAINDEIGAADVWRAGNNEVAEYIMLKDSIDKLGSFEADSAVYLFVRFTDIYAKQSGDGIPYALPELQIKTPLSIKIDLTGTALAGKNIDCSDALSVRSLASNQWVVNIKIGELTDNYFTFKVHESEDNTKQYTPSRPILTRLNNTVTSDIPCKFVLWRKLSSDDDYEITEVLRIQNITTEVHHNFEPGYTYYVGGISIFRNSSLISFFS